MIVFITYKTGQKIAIPKNDPHLLETLIHDFARISKIEQAEFVQTKQG